MDEVKAFLEEAGLKLDEMKAILLLLVIHAVVQGGQPRSRGRWLGRVSDERTAPSALRLVGDFGQRAANVQRKAVCGLEVAENALLHVSEPYAARVIHPGGRRGWAREFDVRL